MTFLGLILLLLIASIVGVIGQALSGNSIGDMFASILVGFIGAYIGIWLSGQLGLPELFSIRVDGGAFPIVWGIVGAAIFSMLLGMLTSDRV